MAEVCLLYNSLNIHETFKAHFFLSLLSTVNCLFKVFYVLYGEIMYV